MSTSREVGPLGHMVAAILRQRAGLLGVNYSQIARHVGMPQSTVSRAMRGERQFKLEELFAVCAALDVEVHAVMEEAERADGARERPKPIPSRFEPS